MKMISLPNGKFLNPAHVDAVEVYSHFWNSKQFYVEVLLRNGEREGIAERLDHPKALALREKYVAMVRDSEVDGYQFGYDEGYEEGRSKGYDIGKADGYRSGYDAGMANTAHRERFLVHVYEFRDELEKELENDIAMTRDRRRYLRHAISAIRELIARLSSSAVTNL
jgi:flagellar biosynthesis/type III secretory pathway protein FliH